MASGRIEFAALVPKTMSDLSPPGSADGNTVAKGEMRDATQSDQYLAFDLSQVGDLAWYVVQVVGPDAKAVASGILTAYLYDKLRQVAVDPEKFKLIVRLPSGRRVRFGTKDKELIEELKKEFEEQTK